MGKAGKYAQCRPCNVIEMLGESGSKGGRAAKRQQAQLAKQYSDNVELTSSLEEAFRAALQKKQE